MGDTTDLGNEEAFEGIDMLGGCACVFVWMDRWVFEGREGEEEEIGVELD